MSDKNAKAVRSQLRQIAKDTYPEIFTQEVKEQMLKEISPMVTAILDSIKKEMLQAVNRAKEQTEAKENQLIAECSKHLDNMNSSMASWQLLLTEKLQVAGLVGPEFNEELESKKAAVREELSPKAEVEEAASKVE